MEGLSCDEIGKRYDQIKRLVFSDFRDALFDILQVSFRKTFETFW